MLIKDFQMLTQAELKYQLSYDPYTGLFKWIVLKPNMKIGDIAGSPDSHGYINISIKNKKYSAHRLAWLYITGIYPKNLIDHKNLIRNDNRFLNLRECTYQQNNFNRPSIKGKTSKFKGVSFCKERRKWIAHATLNKKSYFLGRFDSEILAASVYEEFSKRNHGEFSYGLQQNEELTA